MSNKLRFLINFPKFFLIDSTGDSSLSEFIKNYIKDSNKTSYKPYYDACSEVRNEATSLLLGYGDYMDFDQINKLEYVSNNFNISVQVNILMYGKENQMLFDEDVLEWQAIQIYKTYQILSNPIFRIPKYKEEEEVWMRIKDNHLPN